MFSRKESEILKRVKEIGLENSKLPPEKISNKEWILKKKFYNLPIKWEYYLLDQFIFPKLY